VAALADDAADHRLLAGRLDGGLDRGDADELAEAAIAGIMHHAVPHGRAMGGTGIDAALAHGFGVIGQPRNAVRVDAAQARAHQHLGGDGRLVVGHADAAEHARGPGAQRLGGETGIGGGIGHGWASLSAGDWISHLGRGVALTSRCV
jgi:hypothetical protein